MSAVLIAGDGAFLDWPATWDKPIALSADEKWLRFMRRLWLGRWPVIWRVLANRCARFGIGDVRKLLPRSSDSTTAMQAAAWHARSLPETKLADCFNEGWDMLPQPVMVVDTEAGVLLEDHVHMDVLEDGSWVHATLDDCSRAAAYDLIADRIEALGKCSAVRCIDG